jgi:exonuclease III
MDAMISYIKVLSWNVRGLNNVARQEEVKQITSSCKPQLVCLQETKLSLVTPSVVRSILGPQYENSFVHLPAMGIRGGIIIAVLEFVCSIDHPVLTQNTLTATMLDHRNSSSWSLTCVYGPQRNL